MLAQENENVAITCNATSQPLPLTWSKSVGTLPKSRTYVSNAGSHQDPSGEENRLRNVRMRDTQYNGIKTGRDSAHGISSFEV